MITLPKKISVIVPNYNYRQYLEKRMRSILRQTYPIYEIIILDDASTDGSGEWLEKRVPEWQMENPAVKMRLMRNSVNSGKVMRQWEKGLRAAKGDFVWIAEADDLCGRKFLERVMRGFEDREDLRASGGRGDDRRAGDVGKVVISYCESRIINGAGLMIAPSFRWSRDRERTGHFRRSFVRDGREEIAEIMAIRCTIPNVSAVVWRKDALKKNYLKEAESFRQVGDWYLYAKVLSDGKISYTHAALNYFRVHRSSVTGQSRKSKQHFAEVLKMHKWFLENFQIPEVVQERMRGEEERLKNRM